MPQSDLCSTCPQNQWGSASQGRGKACKNIARLAVLPSDCLASPEDVEEAQLALIKVPVTSVKAFVSYVQSIADRFKRPPFGVVSTVSLEPDPKTTFRMDFQIERDGIIKNTSVFEPLLKRIAQAGDELVQPYIIPEADDPPSKKVTRAVVRRTETRKAPTARKTPAKRRTRTKKV